MVRGKQPEHTSRPTKNASTSATVAIAGMYRTNALNTGAGSTNAGTATGMAAAEPSTDPALCGAAGAGD